MKKKNSFFLCYFLFCTLIVSSCIPDNVKQEMDQGMHQMQQMLADQHFKSAVGAIGLHKLRNGKYPASLYELKYLNPMDSTMFNFVEYKSLDSLYELNVKGEYPSLTGKEMNKINLKYPKEFWKGLGCSRSNAM